MRTSQLFAKWASGGVLGCVLVCGLAHAGNAFFTFETDILAGMRILTNNPNVWPPGGGNPGRYLSLTDAVSDQHALVLFPNYDGSNPVRAFVFSADVRIGNPRWETGEAADGFSVNFARTNDPVIVNWNTGNALAYFAMSGAPEMGVKKGVAISFDAWDGNMLPDTNDIQGVIVRVDNRTILRYALPTLNGAVDDPTSLQTGPWDGGTPEHPAGSGSATNLGWARLEIELNQLHQLSVRYKGATIVDRLEIDYTNSPSQILLAARTGPLNQNQHLDNVLIRTTWRAEALVTSVSGSPFGFTATIQDVEGSGSVQSSVVVPETVAARLNGELVEVAANKTDNQTAVTHVRSTPLPSGSQNRVEIVCRDTQGYWITNVTTFIVGTYLLAPVESSTPLGSGDASRPGFNVRTHQVNQTGDVGLAAVTARAEQQLAGVGILSTNVANLIGAVEGVFAATNVVNWEESALDVDTAVGQFHENFNSTTPASAPQANTRFPGIPGTGFAVHNRNSFAVELLTYLEIPQRGCYTFGVNSDDGFKLTFTDQAPTYNGALQIVAPAEIAGLCHAVSAGWDGGGIAAPIVEPVRGRLVYADPPKAETALVNAGSVLGNIVLIDRGVANYADKLLNAFNAGATAAIVANDKTPGSSDGPFPVVMMVTGRQVDLPALMIGKMDADLIKSRLTNGVEVTIRLDPDLSPGIEFNGGRGALDTWGDVVFPESGVYPLRCVYYDRDGGASLELFMKGPDGQPVLLNGAAEGAFKAYRARTGEPGPRFTLIEASATGIHLEWTGGGTLQVADDVTGTWEDVPDATSPFDIPLEGLRRFARIKL